MPLGSSSAAPVMRPGPSCFSSGNRAAGLPAAETAASFSSFAIMAAVGKRRAARRCGSVRRIPDKSLNRPDDSNSGCLAQILRQYVIGIALLEFGQLSLDLGHLALGPELANVLEPFFRRALLGFGDGDTARRAADCASALERRCGFPKTVRARSWGGRRRLRRSDWLLNVEGALGIRQGLY